MALRRSDRTSNRPLVPALLPVAALCVLQIAGCGDSEELEYRTEPESGAALPTAPTGAGETPFEVVDGTPETAEGQESGNGTDSTKDESGIPYCD